jgi:hypothetical protein
MQLTPNQAFPAVTDSVTLRSIHAERMRRALNAMVGGLAAFRRSSWRFKDANRGRYTVDHALLSLIDEAIEAGADEEQAMAPIRALGAYVKSRFAAKLPPLRELVRLETEAEGKCNEAAIDVLTDPCPKHRAALAATARAQGKLLFLCAERAEREDMAAEHGRPMGVPKGAA